MVTDMWLSGNAVITALVREKQRNMPQSAEMEGVHLGANTNTNTDPQTKSERIPVGSCAGLGSVRSQRWRLSLRQFHSNTEREREREFIYRLIHKSKEVMLSSDVTR